MIGNCTRRLINVTTTSTTTAREMFRSESEGLLVPGICQMHSWQPCLTIALVLKHITRLHEVASCYSKTALGTDPSGRQQGCNTRIALCRIQAAKRINTKTLRAEGGGGRPRHDSEHSREEVECLAGALLLVEDGRESCRSTVVDNAVRDAHFTVGMFLLCEEWDVDEALHHFSAAVSTSGLRQESLPEEEESRGGGESIPSRDGFEWGPVWLLQVRFLRLTICRLVSGGNCTHTGNGFGGRTS